MELPPDFCHEPPEGYRYETDQYRRNIVSIWLRFPNRFSYCDHALGQSGDSTIQKESILRPY